MNYIINQLTDEPNACPICGNQWGPCPCDLENDSVYENDAMEQIGRERKAYETDALSHFMYDVYLAETAGVNIVSPCLDCGQYECVDCGQYHSCDCWDLPSGPGHDSLWVTVLNLVKVDYFYTQTKCQFVNAKDSLDDWIFGD